MGLDITAYRWIVPAPDIELDEDGNPIHPSADCCVISAADLEFTEESWPGRSCGIRPGAYRYADAFDFHAGSYGGYGNFRRALCQLAGHPPIEEFWDQPYPSGPFAELLHFADNEGVIGAEVSAKLAKDFAEHEADILPRAPDRLFRERYLEWRKAFETAADSGAVVFH